MTHNKHKDMMKAIAGCVYVYGYTADTRVLSIDGIGSVFLLTDNTTGDEYKMILKKVKHKKISEIPEEKNQIVKVFENAVLPKKKNRLGKYM